ncbi:MAG: hypothetical protein HYV01_03555 [Deltaproteobacteria bacterium]|nr:hypothetical protein [Deltaproteobacteria bacterium]
MKKVYSAKDPLMVGHLKNVLSTFGTPIDCWPELWVVDDAKLAKAKSILKKTLAPLASVKKPWRCEGCGENIEGQFSECWNCGRSCEQRTALRVVGGRATNSLRDR